MEVLTEAVPAFLGRKGRAPLNATYLTVTVWIFQAKLLRARTLRAPKVGARAGKFAPKKSPFSALVVLVPLDAAVMNITGLLVLPEESVHSAAIPLLVKRLAGRLVQEVAIRLHPQA
mmetsp:Transcript_577/g.1071  ORF Transcript_577/g.1071 Transcript_577/m.1071 type:complete len:117 (+) Transcript_577:438-788(+)